MLDIALNLIKSTYTEAEFNSLSKGQQQAVILKAVELVKAGKGHKKECSCKMCANLKDGKHFPGCTCEKCSSIEMNMSKGNLTRT